MPITIGSNIASLKAQRQLSKGTAELSKTYERLSSGQRINRAADDAAGLAISESLKSDKRVFNQGVRNFNDGISLLNIADGAVENLSNITIRLKELAEQSANGTYSVTQRKAIDKEAQALSKEYTRIAQSTKFNGKNLLDGTLGYGLRLQGGFGTDGGIQSGLGGAIGTGQFGSAVTVSSTTLSNGVNLSDLNGDGILDLVGGDGSNKVLVELGRGDGTFQSAVSYASNLGSLSEVKVGDVNGDGNIDIVGVGTKGITGGFAVLLGNGNGTFLAAKSYSHSDSTNLYSLELQDLNNDGVLDLASVQGGQIYSQLGNGDGTFGGITSYSQLTSAGTINGLAFGDLNGDGILDMVTGGYFQIYGGDVQQAQVRLGSSSGTFGAITTYDGIVSAGGLVSYMSVALGDLNGDEKLDIILAGYDVSNGMMAVRLGNGDGTLGAATTYTMDAHDSNCVKLGDLNGDGILDAVTEGNFGSYTTTVRIGTGRGTFNIATTYSAPPGAGKLALGDLNGDGVLDMVTDDISRTRLGSAVEGVGPLLSFKLTSRADALQALSQFDTTLNRLSTQRGKIGAFQSRLNVGTNVLQASSENYAAAESRIRDADISAESSNLVRLNILQQAASAVLGQANLQPQLALRLLSA
jgi:flagellin